MVAHRSHHAAHMPHTNKAQRLAQAANANHRSFYPAAFLTITPIDVSHLTRKPLTLKHTIGIELSRRSINRKEDNDAENEEIDKLAPILFSIG